MSQIPSSNPPRASQLPSTPTGRRSSARIASNSRQSAVLLSDGSISPWTPSSARAEHVVRPIDEQDNLRSAHPMKILSRLLDELQNTDSRHNFRYGSFVAIDRSNATSLLQRCVRKELWDHFNTTCERHGGHTGSQNLTSDLTALKAIGGDLRYCGRAVYLHIVEFADSAVRLYVGQAFNLASRVNRQHVDFRYRRDHPSLHNFAMDRSVSDTFIILAQIRENTESELVLNLLEMWMTLCFETLPDDALTAWLGSKQADRPGDSRQVFGLNVAAPLDQGSGDGWKGAFQSLRESEDKMAREYYYDVKQRPRPVLRAQTQVVSTLAEKGWTRYLPQFLAVITFGFFVGRWSTRPVMKRYAV